MSHTLAQYCLFTTCCRIRPTQNSVLLQACTAQHSTSQRGHGRSFSCNR